MNAEIITPWVGTGERDDPNRSQLLDDYPHNVHLNTEVIPPAIVVDTEGVRSFEDVTGQPSENLPLETNMYIIKINAESSVIDSIEADDTYQVLWSQEVVNEIPE